MKEQETRWSMVNILERTRDNGQYSYRLDDSIDKMVNILERTRDNGLQTRRFYRQDGLYS